MIGQLQKNVRSPLGAAAGNVISLLDELEKILSRNGVLKIAQQGGSPASAAVVSANSTLELAAEVEQYSALQKNFGNDLLKSTSWFRRLKHDAAPWKSATDKVRIQEIHGDFKYWNDNLYGILPHNIRESVLQQGIAGFIFEKEDNTLNLSKSTPRGPDTNVTVLEYARLLDIRHKTRFADQSTAKMMDEILTEMRINSSDLRGIPSHYDSRKPFSTLSCKEQYGCKRSISLVTPKLMIGP